MWPGQQPPGGEQNAQDQQANPYRNPQSQPYGQPAQAGPYAQQPGQAGPYAQQPGQAPWAMPTQPSGTPAVPAAPGGKSRKTLVAVAAAATVVVACAVAGFVVLNGEDDKKDSATDSESTSASSPANGPSSAENPRAGGKPDPVVPGWKVVVNPERGIAFDVPPEWGLKAASWVSFVVDEKDPEEKPLVGLKAPAMLKEKWCQSDEDRNGAAEDTALATVGSRGEKGAKNTSEAAVSNASTWVYGAYAQPDKKKVKAGQATAYTTSSGIAGSVATAESVGVVKKGKCDTDGKATAFAFKNPKGDFVSWTFVGAKGVKDEVPDATIQKILSTVRLVEAAKTS
ncbi:hypothetical protein AB0M39_19945 [Streptomyces sp. NPDC051907]|uniref:hypothetical protein n=1 Tax=Streptomyces sp. NPDC051907 TaxID=3155284 RepID=UPI00341E197D